MAESTEEEHLDNSANSQSKIPLDEIIPSKDTETVNPNQETESMETHAHELHKVPGHGLKHYLFEFLMLFLAVFCGFLAENFREHRVEKEKGIQYIRSFCEDLKYDTAGLTGMIKDYKEKVEKLNLISLCYDSLFAKLSCNSCLTDLFVNAQAFSQLDVSDRTLQQLKNAGGLRLLNPSDADSVTAYDNLVKGYKIDESTVFQETQTSLRNIMNELFNYSALRKLIDNSYSIKGDLLVTTDKVLLTKFFNTLARYNHYCTMYITLQEQIRSKATGIISYFENKYHFE